jgi:hypothetical protein
LQDLPTTDSLFGKKPDQFLSKKLKKEKIKKIFF